MTQILSLRASLRAAAVAALALAPLTAPAQDAPTEPGNPELAEGAQKLSEGFKLLLEGLMAELEPAGDAAAEGWDDLVDWLGDLSLYEAPERLPNGDIIIRRKEPIEPPAEGETDL